MNIDELEDNLSHLVIMPVSLPDVLSSLTLPLLNVIPLLPVTRIVITSLPFDLLKSIETPLTLSYIGDTISVSPLIAANVGTAAVLDRISSTVIRIVKMRLVLDVCGPP